MRKLGDQWIEIIDGKEHTVKAVEGDECHGCMFGSATQEINTSDDGDSEWITYGHACDIICPFDTDEFIIKDLGILNEDGCLTNCWGEYPRIEELVDVHTREHWFRCITRNNVYCATESYETKQQAIDAWNRRV